MTTRRILLDCHTFDAGPQGTSSFLAGIANNLIACAKQRGVNVELHCAASNKENIDRFIRAPYVYHKVSSGFVARNFLWIPRLSLQIKSHYVISQYVRPAIAYGETVVIIHDVLFIDFPHLFGLFYRLIRAALFFLSARTADYVVTVSDYSRERISRWFGVPAKNILVVPNGVTQPGAIRTRTGRPARLRLLSVSRLEQRKRHEWCIKAVEDLRREGIDACLTIVGVGVGPYADAVHADARRVNDGNMHSVTLASRLSDGALDEVYRGSDIFLFPSEAEGFGIPVIEAAARGLPCVVASNTALGELSRFHAGPSFASNSYPAFLQSIADVADAYGDVERDAAVLAPTIATYFNWERSTQILVDHVLAGAIRSAGAATWRF